MRSERAKLEFQSKTFIKLSSASGEQVKQEESMQSDNESDDDERPAKKKKKRGVQQKDNKTIQTDNRSTSSRSHRLISSNLEVVACRPHSFNSSRGRRHVRASHDGAAVVLLAARTAQSAHGCDG